MDIFLSFGRHQSSTISKSSCFKILGLVIHGNVGFGSSIIA